MNSLLKNVLIIIGVYLVFLSYFYLVSIRFEKIENNSKKIDNVVINISE